MQDVHLQVLEQLPLNLQTLVLAAAPKTLFHLLPNIPPSLHMEALRAVHPSIASNASLELFHRDTASQDDEMLWTLLPQLACLKRLQLRNTSGNIDLNLLSRNLSKLTSLTYLSLQCWAFQREVLPEFFTVLTTALGCIKSVQHLSLAGMHNTGYAMQVLAPQLMNLTGLTHLDISRNGLAGNDFITLAVTLTTFKSLRQLVLDNTYMQYGGLESIAPRFSALSSLQMLSLKSCNIGRAGGEALASHLHHLRALQTLLLGDGRDPMKIVQADGMFSILDAYTLGSGISTLAHLQQLDLSGHQFRAHDIKVLLQPLSDHHPLKHLQLERNSLADKGAAELAVHLPKLIHLEHLNVSDNGISADGMSALAPSLGRLTALTYFAVRFNHIGDEGVAVLASHITRLSGLKHLGLHDAVHEYCVGCVTHLTHCLPSLACLEHLDIGPGIINNAWPEADNVQPFAPLLTGLTSLKHLSLSNTGLRCDGAELIAQHLTALCGLSLLDLCDNPFELKGMQALAPALCHLTALQSLKLAWCGLTGEEGAKAVCSCLPSLSGLRCLNLEYNRLGDEGAVVLAEHLSHLSGLEVLLLQKTGLGMAGFEALVSQAVQLTALTRLHVPGNGLDHVQDQAAHLYHAFVRYTYD